MLRYFTLFFFSFFSHLILFCRDFFFFILFIAYVYVTEESHRKGKRITRQHKYNEKKINRKINQKRPTVKIHDLLFNDEKNICSKSVSFLNVSTHFIQNKIKKSEINFFLFYFSFNRFYN